MSKRTKGSRLLFKQRIERQTYNGIMMRMYNYDCCVYFWSTGEYSVKWNNYRNSNTRGRWLDEEGRWYLSGVLMGMERLFEEAYGNWLAKEMLKDDSPTS